MTEHPISPRRDPERIAFAREQRRSANEFSNDVWQMLRGGRMLREKFRREYPLGPYTLDFVCLRLRLNIEIDGSDHFTDAGKQHDLLRDAYCREQGFEVMRINGFRLTQDSASVRREIEIVVRRMIDALCKVDLCNSPSPPAPLPGVPGRGEPEH